ncbi:MAG: FecR family protein, partial [Tannerellaceae bacterium]|nr:FecR family protein [Tannerellaceae bacterium]
MNDRLLLRFIERKCTPEETRKVYRWINASEKNRKHYVQMQTVWSALEIEKAAQTKHSTEEKQIAEILIRIRETKKKKQTLRFLYAAAGTAAAILFCLFSLTEKENTKEFSYEQLLAEQISDPDQIQIIQHTGERILLTDSMVTINYEIAGRMIINQDTIFTDNPEDPTMHTLYTPYGKRSKLSLPDGSIVHLNAGSILIYPSDFSEEKREVFLEGEGFFEIKKEEKRKFYVQTLYKTTEVLGTRFNIITDKENQSFTAILVDGEIALNGEKETYRLQPNECYQYKALTKQETLEQVDVSFYISWIDGKLKFEREQFRNVLQKIEKQYNIQITLHDNRFSGKLISGSLELNERPEKSIDHLLETIIPNYQKLKQQTLINIYSIN